MAASPEKPKSRNRARAAASSGRRSSAAAPAMATSGMGASSGGRPSSIRPPAAVPSSATATARAPYHASSAARGRASSAPERVTANAAPRIARSRKSAVAIQPADAPGSANPEITRYTAFHSAGGENSTRGPSLASSAREIPRSAMA